jgi:hypothetical protein
VAAGLNDPQTATKREGSHRAALPFSVENSKKLTNYLADMRKSPIFATSNQISGTPLTHKVSVLCVEHRGRNITAPRGVWDNHPKVSANLNLTARSAVSLLSNVKSS